MDRKCKDWHDIVLVYTLKIESDKPVVTEIWQCLNCDYQETRTTLNYLCEGK